MTCVEDRLCHCRKAAKRCDRGGADGHIGSGECHSGSQDSRVARLKRTCIIGSWHGNLDALDAAPPMLNDVHLRSCEISATSADFSNVPRDLGSCAATLEREKSHC